MMLMRELELAKKAALVGGKEALKYFGKIKKVSQKTSFGDFATKADIAAEKKILSIIKKRFPEHDIVAEESGLQKSESDFTWFVDPIDGTTNFFHKNPFFCCSVALRKKNKFVVGAVYDPIRKELFHAAKGKGAFLNGKRIKVSNASKLNQCLGATGFAYDRKNLMKKNLKLVQKILPQIHGIRRDGAAALDLCYVASGRFDLYWEFGLKPWDLAAGIGIIEEAGGKVTDEKGKPVKNLKKWVVASNSKVHSKLIKELGFK